MKLFVTYLTAFCQAWPAELYSRLGEEPGVCHVGSMNAWGFLAIWAGLFFIYGCFWIRLRSLMTHANSWIRSVLTKGVECKATWAHYYMAVCKAPWIGALPDGNITKGDVFEFLSSWYDVELWEKQHKEATSALIVKTFPLWNGITQTPITGSSRRMVIAPATNEWYPFPFHGQTRYAQMVQRSCAKTSGQEMPKESRNYGIRYRWCSSSWCICDCGADGARQQNWIVIMRQSWSWWLILKTSLKNLLKSLHSRPNSSLSQRWRLQWALVSISRACPSAGSKCVKKLVEGGAGFCHLNDWSNSRSHRVEGGRWGWYLGLHHAKILEEHLMLRRIHSMAWWLPGEMPS